MTESRLSKYQQANRAHMITFMTVLQKCPIFISLFILNGDRYKVPLEHNYHPLFLRDNFKRAVDDPVSLDTEYFSDHQHWDNSTTSAYDQSTQWPLWARISTFDRLAVHHWFNSPETAVEREAFLNAGILLKIDRVWAWQHRATQPGLGLSSVVTATADDSKIYSNTRYHHVYRIFSCGRYDPTSAVYAREVARIDANHGAIFSGFLNGSDNKFFDQDLYVLIDKIKLLRGKDGRFSSGGCGSYSYTRDGAIFSSYNRENCELVHDIWRVYAGDADTAVKYYLDSSTRPGYHKIAIGDMAIAHLDELAATKSNRIRSLPAHQLRQYPNDLTELREKIFSNDIFV